MDATKIHCKKLRHAWIIERPVLCAVDSAQTHPTGNRPSSCTAHRTPQWRPKWPPARRTIPPPAARHSSSTLPKHAKAQKIRQIPAAAHRLAVKTRTAPEDSPTWPRPPRPATAAHVRAAKRRTLSRSPRGENAPARRVCRRGPGRGSPGPVPFPPRECSNRWGETRPVRRTRRAVHAPCGRGTWERGALRGGVRRWVGGEAGRWWRRAGTQPRGGSGRTRRWRWAQSRPERAISTHFQHFFPKRNFFSSFSKTISFLLPHFFFSLLKKFSLPPSFLHQKPSCFRHFLKHRNFLNFRSTSFGISTTWGSKMTRAHTANVKILDRPHPHTHTPISLTPILNGRHGSMGEMGLSESMSCSPTHPFAHSPIRPLTHSPIWVPMGDMLLGVWACGCGGQVCWLEEFSTGTRITWKPSSVTP